MSGRRYSFEPEDATKTAKAFGRRLQLKPRFANEVARAIKGRPVDGAIEYLERVESLEAAVPVRRHVHGAGHRRGMGPGRYPVKAAAAIRRLLESAKANAEHKGLDPEKLVVTHAAAYSAGFLPGFMPRARGRSSPWMKALSHVEIVVSETEES